MILKTTNGIPYYQFENLGSFSGLEHGVFTRAGGVSPAPYTSLNIGLNVGDNSGNVAENRRRIATCFGSMPSVWVNQVHGTDVRVTVAADRTEPHRIDADADTADAMVSNRAGSSLTIQVADCQAVLVYDDVRKVIANIHSGWRGSVGNIIGKTLAVMENRFGSRPTDLVAGVGPSLGPCCAEFVHYRKEIPDHLWGYRDRQNRFNFWAVSRDQLRGAGVPADCIEIGGLCTRCRPDLFFSFRKERITGRFAAVIGLAAKTDSGSP